MIWLGEKTEFKFDVATEAESGATLDVVVETVTSCWVVRDKVKKLCEEMAAARGEPATAASELERVLRGRYEFMQRELERQGAVLEPDEARVFQDLQPEAVTDRLRTLTAEADTPVTAAAYVLDAALDPWGFFIGNVQFHTAAACEAVKVLHVLPQDESELLLAIAPWLEQLPSDAAREVFVKAVDAAKDLDGASCRAYCEVAAETLAKRRQ